MSILSRFFKRKPVDEQEAAKDYFDSMKYKTGPQTDWRNR